MRFAPVLLPYGRRYKSVQRKQLLILAAKAAPVKQPSRFIQLADAKAYADCETPRICIWHPIDRSPTRSTTTGSRLHRRQRTLRPSDLQTHCRFAAITVQEAYTVHPFVCEGCGLFVCLLGCCHPMEPAVAGEHKLYAAGVIGFYRAAEMGSGNSENSSPKSKSNVAPHAQTADLAIIDGSRGSGPVIAFCQRGRPGPDCG